MHMIRWTFSAHSILSSALHTSKVILCQMNSKGHILFVLDSGLRRVTLTQVQVISMILICAFIETSNTILVFQEDERQLDFKVNHMSKINVDVEMKHWICDPYFLTSFLATRIKPQ